MFGPRLEVEMSQKCPPFGATQISELKVQKIDGFGALLDGQMLFCVAGARDDALCQK
jgi:hypothetical protein